MSFLENPFAEGEDEEAVPDNPFGDYDVFLRENDYNALLVEETTLESRQRAEEERHASQILDFIQQNAKLRQQLTDSVRGRSQEEKPAPPSEVSAEDLAFSDARRAVLVRLEEVCERSSEVERELQSSSLVWRERAATFLGAQRSLEQRVEKKGAAGPPLASEAGSGGDLESEDKEATTLSFDMSTIERWVRVLVDDIRSETSSFGNKAEWSLVCAFIKYIRFLINHYTELHAQMHSKSTILQNLCDALGKARQTATQLACLMPPLNDKSFFFLEHTEVLLANRNLKAEIQRLEAAVASLLEEDALKAVARDHVEVARHYCVLEHLEKVKEHNEQMGREVLFLRQLLSQQESTADEGNPFSLHASQSGATDERLPDEAPALVRLHQFNTRILLRREQMEALLQRGSVVRSVSSEACGEVQVKVLQTLVRLQNASLRALSALNANFLKQAEKALLLTQLVQRDGDFDNQMVELVLDVPPHDGEELSSEVMGHLTEADALIEQLQRELASILATARHRDSVQARLCLEMQQLLLQSLPSSSTTVQWPLQEAGTAPAQSIQGCPGQQLILYDSIGPAVEAELTAVSNELACTLRGVSASLTRRETELKKKLDWFNRQAYTRPLRELRALQQRNDVLADNLSTQQASLGDEAAVYHYVSSLQFRLEGLQQAVATLNAEEASLQEQIESLERSGA